MGTSSFNVGRNAVFGRSRYAWAMEYTDWMRQALKLAQKAAEEDEVPVGALIFNDAGLVSSAYNRREAQQSPLGHAEVLAVDLAAQRLGRWRLSDCTLVVTLEPCVMCAGTLFQARLKTVVYGATDLKGGSESLFSLLSTEKLNHRLEVIPGVLAEEGAALLSQFFKKKRSSSSF